MSWAPIALSAAGTLVGTMGALRAGDSAKKLGQYEAQIARNNAIVAEQNADYAIKAGMTRAQAKGLEGAATTGRIRAAVAARGIDVNKGTAADVQESARELAQLDTETTLHHGYLEAYGYRTQAANLVEQAKLDEAAAEESSRASKVRALGTLLSGLSATGGMYAKTFG